MDMGTKEAAEKWNVSQQTVQKWCREKKIPGVTQDQPGSPWHIPMDAQKPQTKKGQEEFTMLLLSIVFLQIVMVEFNSLTGKNIQLLKK